MKNSSSWPVSLLVVFALGASGCGPLGGTVCTEEARSSVNVTVTDTTGAALAGVVVTYQVDGGEVLTADCVSIDSSLCTEFVAGWEVEGSFVITATLEGYFAEPVSVTVGKTEDDCHVESEFVTIELAPVP